MEYEYYTSYHPFLENFDFYNFTFQAEFGNKKQMRNHVYRIHKCVYTCSTCGEQCKVSARKYLCTIILKLS